MMKKTKFNTKKFLKFFIPIASLVSASAIIVPMTCLILQEPHIVRTAEQRRHFIKLEETSNINFELRFEDPTCDVNKLSCEWTYTISSLRNCIVAINDIVGYDQGNFIVNLSLLAKDSHQIQIGDSISFDLHFVYKDNNEVIWKQDLLNNYIKIEGDNHG